MKSICEVYNDKGSVKADESRFFFFFFAYISQSAVFHSYRARERERERESAREFKSQPATVARIIRLSVTLL